MAKQELILAVESLARKADNLMGRINSLQEKILQLENENSILREQHETDTKQLQKALKDVEFLSLSHRLADSPEALLKARKTISRLISNIDSCLQLINED